MDEDHESDNNTAIEGQMLRKNNINTEIDRQTFIDLTRIRNENTTYAKVMSNPRGAFGFISLVFGLVMWTKIDTTLAEKF